MTTKAKKTSKKEQKLLGAVEVARLRLVRRAAATEEAEGPPLVRLGPSATYEEAFNRYGQALRELLAFECPLEVADWSWDGYLGHFHFYWEFGAPCVKPDTAATYDTAFVAMRVAGHFDLEVALDVELHRLREEAEHYDELRRVAVRWAADQHARKT